MKRNEYKNESSTTKKIPQCFDKDVSSTIPLSHLSDMKALAPTEYMCTETDNFALQNT